MNSILFLYPGYPKQVDRKRLIIVRTTLHSNERSINTNIQYMKEQDLVVSSVSIKQTIGTT